MKTTLTIALAAMLAFLPACGGDSAVMSLDDAKAMLTKGMKQGNDIKSAFDGITDEATAKSALPNLTKWIPALTKSQSALSALPSSLTDKMPDFKKFGGLFDGIKAKAMELLKNAAIKGVLGKVLGAFGK